MRLAMSMPELGLGLSEVRLPSVGLKASKTLLVDQLEVGLILRKLLQLHESVAGNVCFRCSGKSPSEQKAGKLPSGSEPSSEKLGSLPFGFYEGLLSAGFVRLHI